MKWWIWVAIAIFTPLCTIVADEPKPENEPTVQSETIRSGSEDSADSAADAAAPYSHLERLEWMVGTWEAQESAGTATTTCRWTKNRNFLMRTFRIVTADELELEGTQVIGWDPIRKQIRSWMFDSEGGFGGGWWNGDEQRWTVKTSQVLAGGKRAAAINVMTQVDEDKFTWRSINRELDGEMIPNGPEVTFVRAKAKK